MVLALDTAERLSIAGATGWIGLALVCALYGWAKHYPFFPLFAAGILVPVLGPAIVLVAVAVASRHESS